MLILGHRGAPSQKTENTIGSFEAALSNNVDGIELDIQLTKDGKIAVYHDFTITAHDKAHLVSNLSLTNLQSLCTDFIMPSLEEVCEICPQNKILNIEIKSQKLNNFTIIEQTLSVLEDYKLHDNVIISSFNPFVLREVKRKSPRIKLGLLWTKNDSEGWFVTHYSYYQIKPYSFHANIDYINSNFAKWILDHNMQLFLYTVNTQQELHKAQEVNAHGIFTDFPTLF